MSLDYMVKEIKAFPETKNLKYEYHDITTVYQYIRLKKAFIDNKEVDSYEPVLKEDPIRIEYVPSLKYEKELQIRNKVKNIDTTYHSDYLLDAKFKDFEAFNEERKKALNEAKNFVRDFEKKTLIKGLYIYGQNRSGKTFLLSAIVNELASKDVKTIFAYVPDLIRSIHGSIDEGLLEERVQELKSCDLLVLDDLGSAFMNRWFRDQIFGPILQYRLNLGLPVLVSSNFDLNQLATFFIDEKVANDKFGAVRIITRLRELTKTVKLTEKRY